MDKKQATMLTILGGLGLAVGSFLAWGTVGPISVSGIDAGSEGWITFIAGVVLAAAGYMAYSGKPLPMWVGWTALVVGGAVALINFFDIMGEELVSVGIGMWIAIAGTVLGLVGLLVGRKA